MSRIRKLLSEKRNRPGAAAVEMAIVLLLLLTLVFGIIEVGRMIMVHQVITNAAREGARRAVIPGATDAQVEDRVDQYLTSAGITGHTRTIEINGSAGSLSTAPAHAKVGIYVSVPYSNVSWGVMELISPSKVFESRVNMRKE